MNNGCEKWHNDGIFDRWFEGIHYVNEKFFDNEAEGCSGWPWPADKCAPGLSDITERNAAQRGFHPAIKPSTG